MTDKLRKAAQQALYAMAMLIDPEKLEPWQIELYDKTTNALRTALVEQPAEQSAEHGEPDPYIGWLVRDADGRLDLLTDLQIKSSLSKYERLSKLYTAPQPAKREPLTDERINSIFEGLVMENGFWLNFARAIERAHGIGGEV